MSVKVSLSIVTYLFSLAAVAAVEPFEHQLILPEKPFENLRHDVILNGRNAESSDFDDRNFIVRLIIKDTKTKKTNKCTGFIIATDVVMTAGHCLKSNNKRITVKFGYGGEYGFVGKTVSRTYRSIFPRTSGGPSVSQWENGRLKRNRSRERQQRRLLKNRTEMQDQVFASINRFRDIALVKINYLPEGFGPISFFQGRPVFGEEVFVPGFGVNNCLKKKVEEVLKIGAFDILGRAVNSGQLLGYQYYDRSSKKAKTCFGDSGAPVLIRDEDGQLKVLGVHIFGYQCGASSWLVRPNLHWQLIRSWIEEFRRTTLA